MNYGSALRISRAARGFSQKKLAVAADLTPSYVSLIESGRRVPTMPVLEALAKALKIPLHLIVLLASEAKDLHGISESTAQELGDQLLRMLVHR